MRALIAIILLVSVLAYSNQTNIDPELELYIKQGNTITSPFDGILIEQEFFRNQLLIPSQRYMFLHEQYGIQEDMINAMTIDYKNWTKQKQQLEFEKNLFFGLAIGGVSIGFCGITFGILKGFNII
jgi:hypothetical protein